MFERIYMKKSICMCIIKGQQSHVGTIHKYKAWFGFDSYIYSSMLVFIGFSLCMCLHY